MNISLTTSKYRPRGGLLETLLCGALSLGAGACALDSDDATDLAAGNAYAEDAQSFTAKESGLMLAAIDFTDGRSVTFYEAEPGFLYLRERGPVGSMPLTSTPETEGLNSAELYEYLSGRQAPAELTAAVARGMVRPAGAVDGANEPAPAAVVPEQAPRSRLARDGVGVVEAALSTGVTSAQFQAALCPVLDADFYNWINVTGTGSVQHNDIDNFRSASQALRGTIHFTAKYRTWWTWSNMANTDIPAGWYEKVERTEAASDYDFDAKASTTEADGDLYNMCTHF